jgi:hypothetical protein
MSKRERIEKLELDSAALAARVDRLEVLLKAHHPAHVIFEARGVWAESPNKTSE